MKKTTIRTMRKTMLILLSTLVVLTILLVSAVTVCRLNNTHNAKIATENAIQESTYIEIGGIEQYLQIRGEDSGNPVILWLHGGPGFPLTYLNYRYQPGLEKEYTIACWEQRGCGRTYYRSGSNEQLNIELLLADMDEIVDYLRERFGQEKIIIMGQSWGTALGVDYINRYPQKVAAYIGVGQVTNFAQGKIYAAECAMEKATEKGNTKDVKLLESGIEQIKQLTADDRVEQPYIESLDVKSLEKMIITSLKYLQCDGEMSGMEQIFSAVTGNRQITPRLPISPE